MTLLDNDAIKEQLETIKSWERVDDEIFLTLSFDSFAENIEFVNKVAEIAERADHHPDFLVEYKHLSIALSTHSEGGLTQKDFDLAHRIDELI